MGKLTVRNNPDAKRYEAEFEGRMVKIDYIATKNRTYLTHTEVPVELEGQGLGTELVEAALEDIESNGKQLVPLCPFVAAYIKENPDWARLLAPGYHV